MGTLQACLCALAESALQDTYCGVRSDWERTFDASARRPKEFWTPEPFMDELDNLLNHLGISECFDLVGQSWGGASNLETYGRLKHILIQECWLGNTKLTARPKAYAT